MLVPNQGSYYFIIVFERLIATLYNPLKHYFRVFNHSFKILYDGNTIQQSVTANVFQRYGDIAILAKTDDVHTNKFQPSLFLRHADDAKRSVTINGVLTYRDESKKPKRNAQIFPADKVVELHCKIICMTLPVSRTFSKLKAGPNTAALGLV